MSLWRDFLTNSDQVIDKWHHYFPVYERHFAPWVGRQFTMLEIGVSKGGSLKMWQRYFGPYATIVGIDIDPACSKYEAPGISVRIGDQSDPAFLDGVLAEFGTPSIVLDDGSHRMDHVRATFEHLYPRLPNDGVYLVEDLHTGFLEEYGGGRDSDANFLRYLQRAVMQMNRHWAREPEPADPVFANTRSVCFYDSIACLEKGAPPELRAAQVGRRGITAKLRDRHIL